MDLNGGMVWTWPESQFFWAQKRSARLSAGGGETMTLACLPACALGLWHVGLLTRYPSQFHRPHGSHCLLVTSQHLWRAWASTQQVSRVPSTISRSAWHQHTHQAWEGRTRASSDYRLDRLCVRQMCKRRLCGFSTLCLAYKFITLGSTAEYSKCRFVKGG